MNIDTGQLIFSSNENRTNQFIIQIISNIKTNQFISDRVFLIYAR